MIKTQNLRRLFEAAQRDNNTERFYSDLSEGLRTKQVRFGDF